MLTQRRPRPLVVVGGVALLLLAGYLGLSHIRGRTDAAQARAGAPVALSQIAHAKRPSPTRETVETAVLARHRKEMNLVRRALESGVADAHGLGGNVQAAVWADGWSAPVAVGDDLDKTMRMWSMAKPVEAIAVLSRAADDHVRPTPGFGVAMHRAIQRSENCSARRMVLELQNLTGGTGGARAAFATILREAGARPIVATQEDGPTEQSADCEAFLEHVERGLRAADGVAVLFGTSRWKVTDAVRFAHALADGLYGSAGAEVLSTMSEPKELSEEPGATFTADPRWGAGLAFRDYPLAYKAGWGGTRQGAFLAGQFAIVTVHGRRVAVAAMFHPRTEPQIDDPGETTAPLALEAVFMSVARTLPRLATTSKPSVLPKRKG